MITELVTYDDPRVFLELVRLNILDHRLRASSVSSRVTQALRFAVPGPRRQGPEAEAIIEGRTGVLFDRQGMNIAAAVKSWFATKPDRSTVRQAFYQEIDEKWYAENQARIIREAIFESTG